MNSFFSEEELSQLGFHSIGTNVLLSRKVSIYGSSNIIIGNNVRIDDFCLLSGEIKLGDFIHVAAYSALYGGKYGIEIDDFTTISSRVVIYAESDDYFGNSLTNPLIEGKYRTTYGEKIILGRHTLIGTGCTLLPGAVLPVGNSVGAMSLVKHELVPWTVYAGIPAKKIGIRSKQVLDLEHAFCEEREDNGK